MLIDGLDDAGAEHRLRRRIGYVFQRVGLFPHLTVAENVGVTPRLLGWDERGPRRASRSCSSSCIFPWNWRPRFRPLCRVGSASASALRARSRRVPRSCSWTTVRRARSRHSRPLGSDIDACTSVWASLTFMVTHDVLEASLLADRLVVMRDGAIVADGTPRELMREHGDAGVRKLMDMPRRQMNASRLCSTRPTRRMNVGSRRLGAAARAI